MTNTPTVVSPAQDNRRKAIRPLFAQIDAQGRQRIWIAARLGISKQRLRAYELGLSRPPEWVVERICELIGFSREMLPSDIAQPVRPGEQTRTQHLAAHGSHTTRIRDGPPDSTSVSRRTRSTRRSPTKGADPA